MVGGGPNGIAIVLVTAWANCAIWLRLVLLGLATKKSPLEPTPPAMGFREFDGIVMVLGVADSGLVEPYDVRVSFPVEVSLAAALRLIT